MDDIKLGTWNVSGWTNDNSYLRKAILYELDWDIIGIEETHLSDNQNNQPQLDNYKWIGHCRKIRHVNSRKTYGGIGFFLKEKLYETYNISIIDNSFDSILGLLFKDKISDYCFTVFCCYLPPAASPYGRDSTAFFTHLLTMLYTHSYADTCFALGDFNSHISNEDDTISIVDDVRARDVLDFTLNKHGESFIDFLKESRMIITQGRVEGQNNFTSISAKGKACVDFIAISTESIDKCISCNVFLVSDIIKSNGFQSFISDKCKPPDHSPICLTFRPEESVPGISSHESQGSVCSNACGRRYMYNTMSNEFLKSDTWKDVLDQFILRLECIDPSQNSVDLFYDDMISKIFQEMDSNIQYKEASKKTRKLFRNHKPFWTDELSEAWKVMSKCKHTNSQNRNLYHDFRSKQKLFNRLLRRTERSFYRKKAIDIETINTTNPTEFWKQIKALGPKRSSTIPMKVYDENGPEGGNTIPDENYVMNKWKEEFYSLYNMPSELNSNFDAVFYNDIMSQLPDIKIFELNNENANNLDYNSPFTMEELDKVCNKLKCGKSVGPDMIPNEVLKHTGIRTLLLDFTNMCFTKNVIPSIWRKSYISPIPKSSTKDPYVPLNYRGISLLSCVYKFYTAALNSRLSSFCEVNSLLVDEQNGFRPGRSCQDHIYTLSSVIRNRKSRGLDTFCAFVDFQKAFDWVSRDLLLYKLATTFDIHGRLFNTLSTIYESSTSQIRLNGKLTAPFDVSSGVKQGDIISPILFSMYLNDLATGIKELNCGIDVDGYNLSILLYADDIVLIAPDEKSLQKMLDFIQRWCNKWRMAINADKTQVVHFRRPSVPRTKVNFLFGEDSLTIVPVYKYLGVQFDKYLNFEKNASVLADAASRALGAIRSKLKSLKCFGFNSFNTLFNSGVLTIADYSAGVWGTKNYAKTEQVSYKAARYFLGVHRFAPVEALLGDMGWSTAKTRHKILIMKYWNRLCELPQSRLTRRVFDWDRKFTNSRGTWSYSARQILIDVQRPDLFDGVMACDIDNAKSIIDSIDVGDWEVKRYKSDKLRYYNLYKYDKNTEDYLSLDLTKYQRSIFAQFRCGILPLEIEVGRYRDIALPNRICQVCHNAVEDEIHFLLECDAYSMPRDVLFSKANEIENDFSNLDEFEKFTFLVSNIQKPVIKFLTSALAIRTNLLTITNSN